MQFSCDTPEEINNYPSTVVSIYGYRPWGGNMIQVSITGDIVHVVSDDNFTDDEWMSVLRQHNLLDRTIEFIDYQVDDYDVPVPLHRWTLHFAPVNITVQESA